jgi:hypothetical protein|nr:MAG TPA: hypothetical protein [Caudoviricetes sp.]
MTANGIEHPDFQNTRELARRDEETIKQKKIKSPKLGKFRVKKGNAIYFFQTEERMKNSIIHTKEFESRIFKRQD